MDSQQVQRAAAGPLAGLRVLEMAGLGPVSFTAMLLADMGAHVVRVARPGHVDMERGATLRGRNSLMLDLKSAEGVDAVMALATHADVLLEGFRAGVMERLGLGPTPLLARNPALVYGRMTGWGQSGPRAQTAGHDIGYIAITGALGAIGGAEPAVPLNLLGDYGGGALYLAMGVLAAVLNARTTGKGQVVDSAICDGTVSLLALVHGLRHAGRWRDARQANTLDGAAPNYRCYRCADGRYVAVGAIEPAFRRALLAGLALDESQLGDMGDRALWPGQTHRLAQAFATRSRDDWCAQFDGTDACVAPVLSLQESLDDGHLRARDAFVALNGETQPAPAPRFSATPSQAQPAVTADLAGVMQRWSVQGFNNAVGVPA